MNQNSLHSNNTKLRIWQLATETNDPTFRVATKLEIELAREIEQKEAQRTLSKSKLLRRFAHERMEMDQFDSD